MSVKEKQKEKRLPAEYFKYFTDNLGIIYSGEYNSIDIKTLEDIVDNDKIHHLKTMEIDHFSKIICKDDPDFRSEKFRTLLSPITDTIFTDTCSQLTDNNVYIGTFRTHYLKSFIDAFKNYHEEDDKLFAIVPIVNRVNFSLKESDNDFELYPTKDGSCEFCGWYTMNHLAYPDSIKLDENLSLSNFFTRTYTCVTGKNKLDLFKMNLEIGSEFSTITCNFTKNGFDDLNAVVIDFYTVPLKALKIDFIEKYFKGDIKI